MRIKLVGLRAILLLGVSGLTTISVSNTAKAQTTPTELVDLSLEDLLSVDVRNNTSETDQSPWEFGLSYTKGSFGGYRSGKQDLSFQDVLFSPGETRSNENYPVVPTYINQSVTSFSANYSFSPDLAFSVSLPYVHQSTDHISSVPGFQDFILKTEGFGDVAFALAYGSKLSPKAGFKTVIGVRYPLGPIDETGDTPRNGAGTLERLPYTMQLGSGTLDLTGSLTYSRNTRYFGGGFNLNATLRTGKNDNDYRLGNNLGTSVFARFTKHHAFQPGIRLNARHISPINGGDASLRVAAAIPFPASITDPKNYGGEKIGAAATLKSCPKSDCRISFSAEYSEPIYQNLNGIQPKERSSFSLSSALRF